MTSHRNVRYTLWALAILFLLFPGLVMAKSVFEIACQQTPFGPLPPNQKFAGKLPKTDWAQGMKSGEATVKNGVIYRVITADNYVQPSITDVQWQQLGYPPRELVLPIPAADKEFREKREAQRMSLIDWIVDRDYGFLPATG